MTPAGTTSAGFGPGRVLARRRFLRGAAVALGAVAAGFGSRALPALAAPAAGCGESAQAAVATVLLAERLAATFYYTGLSRPAIAGLAAQPAVAASAGAQGIAVYLRATLEQEQAHVALWQRLSNTAAGQEFYFPAAAFATLGFTSHEGTFLWTLDHLETDCIGVYLAAARRFGELGRLDLARLALRIVGIECEHRALYRLLSGDEPADNMTLEVVQPGCAGDAAAVLRPYLTGHGFPGGATRAIRAPTPAETADAVASAAGR